jgi:dipeptide/tripeptide permease
MLLFTLFFYKEPKREIEGATLGRKFRDILVAFSDWKFAAFIVLLGLFFWLPFWAFFNLCALYVDSNLDTARLYLEIRSVLGTGIADFLAHDVAGEKRILGETIAHSGYIIMIFQFFVSRIVEKFKAIPAFLSGLFVAALGFGFLGYARIGSPSFFFLGLFLFAVGEMASSPRIQEYITWIAPKEKAGLYMGCNFVALLIGSALSGVSYTTLYGVYNRMDRPEYLWWTLAAHLVVGMILISWFIKRAGEFKERSE